MYDGHHVSKIFWSLAFGEEVWYKCDSDNPLPSSDSVTRWNISMHGHKVGDSQLMCTQGSLMVTTEYVKKIKMFSRDCP